MKYSGSEAGHQEREKWILERKIQWFSEKDPSRGVRIYTGREKRLQLQEQGIWKRAPQRHRLGRASRLRILNRAPHSQPRAQQGFEPVRHRTRAMAGMNDMDEQKRGSHLKPTGRFLQFSGKRKGGWETGGQCWGGGRGIAGETLELPPVNTTFSPAPWAHLRHRFPWTLSNGASCITESDSTGAEGGICIGLNSQGHWQIIGPLFSHTPVMLLLFTLESNPPFAPWLFTFAEGLCIYILPVSLALQRCIFDNFTQLWKKIVFNNWKNTFLCYVSTAIIYRIRN